jgi:hypothetical protein
MDKIRLQNVIDCANKRGPREEMGATMVREKKRIIILRAEEVHSNNSHPFVPYYALANVVFLSHVCI